LRVPCESFPHLGIEKYRVVYVPIPVWVIMCACALPNDLILEVVFPEYPIEHYLDVMAGVPVAVIVKAAGFFEYPRQLHATGPHEFDIGLRGFMAVVKRPLFLGLAPKDLVVPVGVEGRIDVDEVDAGIRQLLELLKIVAAVDDPRIEKW